MGGEGGIGVAGEGADAAGVVFGAFFGEELEGSARTAWVGVLGQTTVQGNQ